VKQPIRIAVAVACCVRSVHMVWISGIVDGMIVARRHR
jgi:hypothetical protein